jgi:hypothetical protein
VFRQFLSKPEIDAEDIRLAEGYRSPFWTDDLSPENDPVITVAVDLFRRLRVEFSSIRTQLALYGIALYVLWVVVAIGTALSTDGLSRWADVIGSIMVAWVVVAFLQGWRIFRLISEKDRAVDAVARDSVRRYEEWLDGLRLSDPEEYLRITTWDLDLRTIEARLKLNEYF